MKADTKTNNDNDSTEEEHDVTSYEKGRELENNFSTFMKHELGWTKTRVGAHMAGKLNVKGAAIDIIGERLDERGKTFRAVFMLWFVAGLFLLVYGIVEVFDGLDAQGAILLLFSLATLLGALVFITQSNKYNKENAWVECKNLKGKANINQIDKSLREKNDYIQSGNKDYKFDFHYFVSSNGFIENALKYAVDKGIICYIKEGETFKRVGYWD